MVLHLCRLCRAFIDWDIPNEEKWSGAVFRHYRRTRLLQASAERKCHLCVLIYQSLLQSRHPEAEKELPDRQIWLEYAPRSFGGKPLRISAAIQPKSLATAGSHDFDEVPIGISYVQLPVGSDAEDGLQVANQLKEMCGEDLPWVLWEECGPTYYLGPYVISEDLFWALVLPYHVGELELVALPGMIKLSSSSLQS